MNGAERRGSSDLREIQPRGSVAPVRSHSPTLETATGPARAGRADSTEMFATVSTSPVRFDRTRSPTFFARHQPDGAERATLLSPAGPESVNVAESVRFS